MDAGIIMEGKVFLSLPPATQNPALLQAKISGVIRSLTNSGYCVSDHKLFLSVPDADAQALIRLTLLSGCDTVWLPKDFQRSPLSVAEYNYAYFLNKKIITDPDRRLQDEE